jgi:hypothetical protein
MYATCISPFEVSRTRLSHSAVILPPSYLPPTIANKIPSPSIPIYVFGGNAIVCMQHGALLKARRITEGPVQKQQQQQALN